MKYEIDKASGALMVDRFLHTAMFYPANYGFIPHTLADDGDPADIMVVGPTPVVPGAIIRCRPIGALMMVDEAGFGRKDPGRAGRQAAPVLHRRVQLARPAGDPDRADRPLLPALQGPGEGQVDQDHRLGRSGGTAEIIRAAIKRHDESY